MTEPTYHREHGHPVPTDHPAAVSRWDVDPAIRPKAIGQLPARRPCRCDLPVRTPVSGSAGARESVLATRPRPVLR